MLSTSAFLKYISIYDHNQCILMSFTRLFDSPKLANKIDVIKLSIAIDTTSPIDAARGVAILSGLTLYLLDSKITATKTKSKKD